jgi:hypothetical protein
VKYFLILILTAFLVATWDNSPSIAQVYTDTVTFNVAIEGTGSTQQGSVQGGEAVFQLPGRIVKIEAEGCTVFVNGKAIDLPQDGLVDTNPGGKNPTFYDTSDTIKCQDGGWYRVSPYFQP